MTAEDRDSILALIAKMKDASDPRTRERLTADLATSVMMASDPELDWASHPPTIINQGGVAYRAYPILARSLPDNTNSARAHLPHAEPAPLPKLSPSGCGAGPTHYLKGNYHDHSRQKA